MSPTASALTMVKEIEQRNTLHTEIQGGPNSPRSPEHNSAALEAVIDPADSSNTAGIGYGLPEAATAPAQKGLFEDLNIGAPANEKMTGTNRGAEQTLADAVSAAQVEMKKHMRAEGVKVDPSYGTLPGTLGLKLPDGTPYAATRVAKLYEAPVGGKSPIEKMATIEAVNSRLSFDQQGKNIDTLSGIIYGPQLKTAIENTLQHLDTNSPAFKGALEILNDSVTLDLAGSGIGPTLLKNIPGYESKSADVTRLMEVAIKSVLLTHPEHAKHILNQLGNGSRVENLLQLGPIADAFRAATFAEVIDKMGRKYQAFNIERSSGTLPTSLRQQNRKELYDVLNGTKTFAAMKIQKLLNGAPVTHKIKSLQGGTPPTAGADIKNVKTMSNGKEVFATPPKLELKVDARRQAAMASYLGGQNIFKGLELRATGGTNAAAADIAETMLLAASETPAKFKGVLKLGLDTVLNPVSPATARELAFSAMKASLEDGVAAGTPLKNRIDAIGDKLKTAKDPVEAYKESSEALLKGMLGDLRSAATAGKLRAELDGLKTTGSPEDKALDEILTQFGTTQKVSLEQIEQLSAIMMGIKDTAERNQFADKLRALTVMNLIREIATDIAKPDTGAQYDLALYGLMRQFSGEADLLSLVSAGASLTPTDLAKALRERLYAGNTDLTLKIPASDPIHAVLATKYGGTPTPYTVPTISAPDTQFTLPSYKLEGDIAKLAHQYLGSIRRGLEGGMLLEISTKSDPDIKTWLKEALHVDPKDLDTALERFKKVVAANDPASQFATIPELIKYSARGAYPSTGMYYTNSIRALEYFVKFGGDINEILRSAENLSADDFLKAVQRQADPTRNIAVGNVVTPEGKNLTLEEQRALVLKNYSELSGKSGLGAYWGALKSALGSSGKKILAQTGVMLGAAAVTAFIPGAAPFVAAGFAAWRVYGFFSQGRALFEAGAKIKGFESNEKWGAAAFAIGINLALQLTIPSPANTMLLAVTEAIGVETYRANRLLKEQRTLYEAHTAYDTALLTKLNGIDLTKAAEKGVLVNIARVLDIPHDVSTLNTDVEKNRIIAEIQAKRAAFYTNQSDVELRRRIIEFSKIVEAELSSEKDKVLQANVEAQTVRTKALENITAFTTASTATKLFGTSWQTLAGALPYGQGEAGISSSLSAGNLFERMFGGESAETLHSNLEGQLDKWFESHGFPESGNVTGVYEAVGSDGQLHTYAAIDLDGNPATTEAVIGITGLTAAEMAAGGFSGDEVINFGDVHSTSRIGILSNGGATSLNGEVLTELYALQNDENLSDIKIMELKGSGEIGTVQAMIMGKDDYDVVVRTSSDTVSLHDGEAYVSNMFDIKFVSDEAGAGSAPEIKFSGTYSTTDGKVVAGFYIEDGGKQSPVAAIDIATGSHVGSYTGSNGETVTPLYTFFTNEGGNGAGITGADYYKEGSVRLPEGWNDVLSSRGLSNVWTNGPKGGNYGLIQGEVLSLVAELTGSNFTKPETFTQIVMPAISDAVGSGYNVDSTLIQELVSKANLGGGGSIVVPGLPAGEGVVEWTIESTINPVPNTLPLFDPNTHRVISFGSIEPVDTTWFWEDFLNWWNGDEAPVNQTPTGGSPTPPTTGIGGGGGTSTILPVNEAGGGQVEYGQPNFTVPSFGNTSGGQVQAPVNSVPTGAVNVTPQTNFGSGLTTGYSGLGSTLSNLYDGVSNLASGTYEAVSNAGSSALEMAQNAPATADQYAGIVPQMVRTLSEPTSFYDGRPFAEFDADVRNVIGLEYPLVLDMPDAQPDFAVPDGITQFEVVDSSGSVIATIARNDVGKLTPDGLTQFINGVPKFIEGTVNGVWQNGDRTPNLIEDLMNNTPVAGGTVKSRP